jgi:hypothetical protein
MSVVKALSAASTAKAKAITDLRPFRVVAADALPSLLLNKQVASQHNWAMARGGAVTIYRLDGGEAFVVVHGAPNPELLAKETLAELDAIFAASATAPGLPIDQPPAAPVK